MTRLPSLKALRAFDQASQTGSFSAAADNLSVSHGAISRLIRQLEDELGVALFQRRSDGVALTEAGERLQRATTPAFRLLQDGCEETRRSGDQEQLVIACPGSFMMRWLIPRLEEFSQAIGGVRVQMQALEGSWQSQLGRVDLAVVHGSGEPPIGWEAHLLAPDELGPVCIPELARQIRHPQAVFQHPLLSVASRADAWSAWCKAVDLRLPEKLAVQDFEHLSFMLEAALTGLGVAIAPKLLVQRDLAEGRLAAPLGFVQGGQPFQLLLSESSRQRVRDSADWLMVHVAEDIRTS